MGAGPECAAQSLGPLCATQEGLGVQRRHEITPVSERSNLCFNVNGELEPGIYLVKPDEVLAQFGRATARREQLGRVFAEIAVRLRSAGIVRRCWVGGSFASRKPAPGDIDLWLLVADGSETVTLSWQFADIFEHERAKVTYGADIFWMTESGAATMLDKVLDCLQTTRDGRVRGVLEIEL